MERFNIVTGAFGFSGKYIAKQLLKRGERVRALTNHPDRNSPLYSQCDPAPLDFTDSDGLTRSMRGATVLFNTYWVRFAHGGVNHAQAVANTRILIRAAERAGIQRIVHVSITNPSPNASTPYFRGKAAVEEAIRSSSLSYAILRPAVLFGNEDILINNIAYLLRRLPVFAVPAKGDYQLQPIFVEDLAALAVDAAHRDDHSVVDAVGPEVYKYVDLVRTIRAAIGSHSRIIHLPQWMVPLLSKPLSWAFHDVLLTRDELRELTGNVLISQQPPTGTTSFRAWLNAHADSIGTRYASELARHYRDHAR